MKLNVFQTSSKRFVKTAPICPFDAWVMFLFMFKLYPCMEICYAKLLKAAKSMFKSCNSRAVWTWLLLEKAETGPWFACMRLHWKVLRPWLIISPMLSFAKTLHAYIWRCGDVMTFKSLMLTPFCFEKSSVRKGILNVKATFSAWFMLKSGRICKNNDHTCLFHCINTCPVPRTMFEHEA